MSFDVQKVTKDVIEWTRDWFSVNGPGCNAVIGISGGKDSTVTAAVCVQALGADRVIGVLLPNGEQHDIDVARAVVKHLGIRSYELNIKPAYDAIYGAEEEAVGFVSDQSRINLTPRIRMTTLYAGDGAGDFGPLCQLTVQEVKAIGRYLGLPSEFVDKVPIDGLCGKTDEDNLGFTYAVLDRYIRTGECDDEATKQEIDRRHKANLFKLSVFPTFPYDGPVFNF